jgi:hypothetical protein
MLAVTRRVRPQALNALRGMASKAKASEEVSINLIREQLELGDIR